VKLEWLTAITDTAIEREFHGVRSFKGLGESHRRQGAVNRVTSNTSGGQVEVEGKNVLRVLVRARPACGYYHAGPNEKRWEPAG